MVVGDFRVRNIVHYWEKLKIGLITFNTFDGYDCMGEDVNDFIAGVQLKEEWFEIMNFEDCGDYWVNQNVRIFKNGVANFEYSIVGMSNGNTEERLFEYVHEVQNYFWGIKGFDLELKETSLTEFILKEVDTNKKEAISKAIKEVIVPEGKKLIEVEAMEFQGIDSALKIVDWIGESKTKFVSEITIDVSNVKIIVNENYRERRIVVDLGNYLVMDKHGRLKVQPKKEFEAEYGVKKDNNG